MTRLPKTRPLRLAGNYSDRKNARCTKFDAGERRVNHCRGKRLLYSAKASAAGAGRPWADWALFVCLLAPDIQRPRGSNQKGLTHTWRLGSATMPAALCRHAVANMRVRQERLETVDFFSY
jgi:hypothetical protein